MPGKHGTLAERLDRRLDKSGKCWVWQGCCGSGYGRINSRTGVRLYTHRVAWELANGPIPDGLFVLHDCDNPPCCNPAHLHLGTQADNVRERDERGRGRPGAGNVPRGESHPHAKLTRAQVVAIRARHAAGGVVMRELGKEYEVSQNAIWCAVRRITWAHVS